MLYFVLVKKARNIVLAASLVIVMLLAVCGPLSCYSAAKYSQNMRFAKILKQNGMLQDGKIVQSSGEISQKDKQEIKAIIRYFNSYYEFSDLKYLPQDFNFDKMKDIFGFAMYDQPVREEKDFSYSLRDAMPLFKIKGYDYFLDFSNSRASNINFYVEGSGKLTVSLQQNQLTLSRDEEILYRNNIEEFVRKIHERNKGESYVASSDMWMIDEHSKPTDKIQVAYLFREIRGSQNELTNEIDLHRAEFYVFIKLNESELSKISE